MWKESVKATLKEPQNCDQNGIGTNGLKLNTVEQPRKGTRLEG